MQNRKKLEDYLYNHDDEIVEKKLHTQQPQGSKWSRIYQKVKRTPLHRFIKK